MAYELNETLSPITRAERLKVNENWDRIQVALNNLQFQINSLVGSDLGDLIRDINEALGRLDDLLEEGGELTLEMQVALLTFEDYVDILEVYVPRMEQGVDDMESLMPVLTNLRDQLTTLNNNVANAEGLRVTAENGRVSAENGRVSAENARVIAENIRQNNELNRIETTEEMERILDNLESFSYSPSQEYDFPNLVLYNGSTYMALQRVTGLTPSNDGTNWRLVAQRGTDGTGSVSSVNGIFPDPNGNVTIDVGGDIINNLVSTRTDASLSANQGRVLNENKLDVSNKATSTEATDGVNNTKWMTPLRTMEAASASLQQAIASETEANAGTANNKVMTPLRVNNVTGTKTNLTTTNKTNLVSAINEIKTDTNEHSEQIGELTDLETTDKTSLVNAINETFTQVVDGKDLIATAINDKGGSASGSDTFALLADAIGNISTGKKFASGKALKSSTTMNFFHLNSISNSQLNFIEVSGLTFRPSVIIAFLPGQASVTDVILYTRFKIITTATNDGNVFIMETNYSYSSSAKTLGIRANGSVYVNSTGFRLPVNNFGTEYDWYAFE